MPRIALLILFLLNSLLFATSPTLAALTPEQLDSVKSWLATPADERPAIETLGLPDQLSKADAKRITQQIWKAFETADNESPLGPLPKPVSDSIKDGRLELKAGLLPLGEHNMPFAIVRREERNPPKSGRPLFLCLHGGGQHPEADGPHSWPINTSEMNAQVQLSLQAYPSEGIYWIPRMADDRLGRWWHYHNQLAFDQVIDHAIAHWGVDPNRVYLLGISEGGYGTDILAPFMGDRFAGASAMASGVGLGNPPANLRNVAYRSDVGAEDNMFDRRKLAVEFHEELDKLHEADPDGYKHSINVQEGRGHGVDYRPGPGWIAEHTRKPFPEKIVWIDQPLDKHRRDRFYWIGLADADRTGRNRIVATADRKAGKIDVTAEQLSEEFDEGHPTHINERDSHPQPLTDTTLVLLLSDDLMDLNKPVEVTLNGKPQTIAPNRSAADILESLAARPDPTMAASCRVEIAAE